MVSMVMSIQMMMVSMGQRKIETTSRYFIVHLANEWTLHCVDEHM